MKLSDYMTKNDLTDEQMASLVGDVSAHGVKKWRYAERIPRPDAMKRIMDVTGGQVTPADFFPAVGESEAPDSTKSEVAAA